MRAVVIEVAVTKCAMRRNKFEVRVNTLCCADIFLGARKNIWVRGFIFWNARKYIIMMR